MSTKPSTLPRHAETSGGTPSAGITEPSSGEKDSGFVASTAASAEKTNWVLWVMYLWTKFLNDLFDTTAGSDTAMRQNAAATFNGAITAAAATFSGLITANAGVTAGAGQHVTVSGAGELKHGDRTLILPAAMGCAAGDAAGTDRWAFSHSNGAIADAWVGTGTGTNNILGFAIPLRVGDRIKEVRAFIRDTSGGNTVSMQIRKSSNTDGNVQLGSTQTSAGGGTNQTLAVTGLTETLASTEYVHVNVAADTTTDTTHHVYGVEVVYDRP